MQIDERLINKGTGEIYDAKDWIVKEWNGRITRVKRLSDKQLAFIESLEYRLGYKPKNHRNMPAYKAVKTIETLQARLIAREQQRKLL